MDKYMPMSYGHKCMNTGICAYIYMYYNHKCMNIDYVCIYFSLFGLFFNYFKQNLVHENGIYYVVLQ